jgi:hypothetical protein
MIRCVLYAATVPRGVLATLAPGVPELDRGHGTHVFDEAVDALPAHNLRVVPDAGAACRGAPVRPSGGERCIVIGDMTMRLRSVTSLSVNGEKRSGMGTPSSRLAICYIGVRREQ